MSFDNTASAAPARTLVHLNVSGTTVTTTIATITTGRAAGSRLASLFSDPKPEEVVLDEAGRVLIDRDDAIFRHVLQWLRTGVIASDDPSILELLMIEAVYWQLSGLVNELRPIAISPTGQYRYRITLDHLGTLMSLKSGDTAALTLDGCLFSHLTLAGCNFIMSYFVNAKFISVNCTKTSFEMADMQGCNFHDVMIADTDFSKADLRRSNIMTIDLRNANFQLANLSGLDLSHAAIAGCNLKKADLTSCNLQGMNLSTLSLQGANLQGANVNDCVFRGADLSNCNLSGLNLSNVDFSEANLTGANLAGCLLVNAVFHGANMSGLDLSLLNLTGIRLQGANLSKCNMRKVNIRELDLSGCNLKGALTPDVSPDIIISCGWEKELHVDSIGTGDNLFSITSEYALGRCVVHPSNAYFAVGAYKVTPTTEDAVLIYAINDTTVFLTNTIQNLGRNPFAIAFSPNGDYLAASSTTGVIKLLRCNTWEVEAEFSEQTSYLWELAFSSDSLLLASVAHDNACVVRNIQTRETRVTVDFDAEPRSCVFLRDNLTVICGVSDGRIHTINIETGEENQSDAAHTGNIDALALNEHGSLFASGGDDHLINIWDILTMQPIHVFTLENIVSAVAFSPDNLSIFAGVKSIGVVGVTISDGQITKYSKHTGTGSQTFVWGLACTHATAGARRAGNMLMKFED